VQVTAEKIKNSRSISQNRYCWGIVVKLIAQHTGHDRSRCSPEEFPISLAAYRRPVGFSQSR
jgi:hypothetical protein